jgi:tRNA A-37 threonylcarbamoyl transferase component Bud32
MIWVRPDLAARFGALAFEDFLALGQHAVKASADGTRRTAWFERDGQRYYLKTHAGVGWREILKNWLQGKPAVVDARTEAHALARCAARAVPAPALVAYGVRGADPGARRSFLVTEALEDAERLSTVLEAATPDFGARAALARGLGALVARLHAAGLAHRDLYLEHVFVRAAPGAAPELFLLDLHRAVPLGTRAARWRAKDLAALHVSARSRGATRGDAARFLCAYVGTPRLAEAARALWRAAARRR